jgi:hypothetical protein
VACGFNLWVLRAESGPVHDLNDSSYHFAMLRWARNVIDQGKSPLDGWYPDLGLGQPLFHHYQSLPHIIGAYVSIIAGTAATFYGALYLLLALWPVSVYAGARLLGWDRWWSQLWGMWLLPLAWGPGSLLTAPRRLSRRPHPEPALTALRAPWGLSRVILVLATSAVRSSPIAQRC